MKSFDRRTFLIATGALALAACGSDKKAAKDPFGLAPRFARELLVPGPLRMPFSLSTDGIMLSDGPETLTGRIVDTSNKVVVPTITAKRRRVTDGIVYWDFHTTLDKVGQYTLLIDGGDSDGAAISITDPANVDVPFPGQQLPAFDTPTTANAGGVDPICTRLEGGPCPFHDITLTEALTKGTPVAYLIGTPAHCQFGTCGPGLEFLINTGKRLGYKLTIVHAEVYTDDTASTPTPAVEAYNLIGEPDLFLADRNGKLVTRLEGVWDQTELDETVNALVV